MQHDNASHGERPLGYVEHVFKTSHELGSFVVVRVVRISGPLDTEHLCAALRAAQQEIPALRAQFNRYERKLQFSERSELPFKVLKRVTDDLWKQVATAELHQRFVDASLLWKARFLRSSHGGQVMSRC